MDKPQGGSLRHGGGWHAWRLAGSGLRGGRQHTAGLAGVQVAANGQLTGKISPHLDALAAWVCAGLVGTWPGGDAWTVGDGHGHAALGDRRLWRTRAGGRAMWVGGGSAAMEADAHLPTTVHSGQCGRVHSGDNNRCMLSADGALVSAVFYFPFSLQQMKNKKQPMRAAFYMVNSEGRAPSGNTYQ